MTNTTKDISVKLDLDSSISGELSRVKHRAETRLKARSLEEREKLANRPDHRKMELSKDGRPIIKK